MCSDRALTFEAVKVEASGYSRRGEFRKGSPRSYEKACRNGWLDLLGLPPCKWTYEAVEKEANKYLTRAVFKDGSYNAYKAACRRGWLDKLFTPEDGSLSSLEAEQLFSKFLGL